MCHISYFTTSPEEHNSVGHWTSFSIIVTTIINQGNTGDSFITAAFNKVNLESILRNIRSSSLKLLCLHGYSKNFHHPVWQILLSLSCHFSVKPSWDTSLWLKWKVPLKSKVIFSLSSVGAWISLQRLTFLTEVTMRVLIRQNFIKVFQVQNLDLMWMWKTECEKPSQIY